MNISINDLGRLRCTLCRSSDGEPKRLDGAFMVGRQRSRIDGRWIEISAVFSQEYQVTPIEWLAAASPPLEPYLELWEAALAQESVARSAR